MKPEIILLSKVTQTLKENAAHFLLFGGSFSKLSPMSI